MFVERWHPGSTRRSTSPPAVARLWEVSWVPRQPKPALVLARQVCRDAVMLRGGSGIAWPEAWCEWRKDEGLL